MYDTILYPTDGSEAAGAALDHALSLAETYDATLHVLFVADTRAYSTLTDAEGTVDVLVEEGERVVEGVSETVEGHGVEAVASVRQGDPAAAIGSVQIS